MGGNIFKDRTSAIKKEHINPTLSQYFSELRRIFPGAYDIFNTHFFHSVGSTGKRPISNDIDLAIDIRCLAYPNWAEAASRWGFNQSEFNDLLTTLTKRARTATPEQLNTKTLLKLISARVNEQSELILMDEKKTTTGNAYGCFPQFSDVAQLKTNVQIDWMVGNIQWLKFAYYSEPFIDSSETPELKGLHRTQFLVALFSAKGMMFSHTNGVKSKVTNEVIATTPTEAMSRLNAEYNMYLDVITSYDYTKLTSYVKQHISDENWKKVIDIYLTILDSTRVDVPTSLHEYWLKHQNRLELTGKFLPADSTLLWYMETDSDKFHR